jgi:F-type H+-transporting ATPase subunit delta
MDQSKITVRYARALFTLGKERGSINSLYKDIQTINSLFLNSGELQQILSNPVIRVSQKKSIINKILHDHVSDLALRFITLIADNKRETEIPGICRNFIDLVRSDQGIVPATVTTSGKLSDKTLLSIRKILEGETGKTIDLTDKVNPSIIGGMILRIKDQQYDGSISSQLKKIKSALLEK